MRATLSELIRYEWPVWLVVGAATWGLIVWDARWSWAPSALYGVWQLLQAAQLYMGRAPASVGFWPLLYQHHRWQRQRAQRRYDRLVAHQADQSEMLEALPLGLVRLDDQDVMVRFNTAAQRLLALQASDVGKPVQRLVRLPEFIRWLEAGGGEPLKLVMPQARLKVLQFQRRKLTQGALLVVEDITQEHDLWQVRRDFIANASHELRTPVTVFRGYLESLLSLEAADLLPWRSALEQMAQQAERMHRIIEDLLTLSAIEQDQGDATQQVVAVSELFQALEEEAHQLSQGRHTLRFRVEATGALRGDPTLLRSIFSNLITNAVRYTPEEGVIDVSWRLSDRGEGVFEVRDTGIGIPREHLPRLTERFYRVDTARSRESGGTGLGLAIVKHALEQHGGRLEVESTPQVGSTFRAIFPANRIVT